VSHLPAILMILSAVLLVVGVVIVLVFRNDTVEEARGRLSHIATLAVSWPGRYFRYRSGHGRHQFIT
jgi:hypothetical protein